MSQLSMYLKQSLVACALLITLPLFQGARADSARIECTSKPSMVMSFWEYKHADLLRCIKLDKKEEIFYLTQLNDAPDANSPSWEGTALLLALNCVFVEPDKTIFFKFEQYLCTNAPFESLSSSLLENLYILAFVKSEDRFRAINFMKRYIGFWENEGDLANEGVPIGESDEEYLEEILLFLEESGYNV